jgi:CheY-like chemotaxis protein
VPTPLILVVDDDPDILEAVGEILVDEGYRVARARDGQEALARLEGERPALVLLDLMMPVMDGVAFARAMRLVPEHAGIPVVVISADGDPARARAVAAQGFLAKPFDIDDLLRAVSTHTGASGPGGTQGESAAPPHT